VRRDHAFSQLELRDLRAFGAYVASREAVRHSVAAVVSSPVLPLHVVHTLSIVGLQDDRQRAGATMRAPTASRLAQRRTRRRRSHLAPEGAKAAKLNCPTTRQPFSARASTERMVLRRDHFFFTMRTSGSSGFRGLRG
jgi:hypothetical protein